MCLYGLCLSDRIMGCVLIFAQMDQWFQLASAQEGKKLKHYSIIHSSILKPSVAESSIWHNKTFARYGECKQCGKK